MAGATVARSAHFALHRMNFEVPQAPAGSEPMRSQTLFAVQSEPWIGCVLPKRWAKRAVTRNAIKRQIYNVSTLFEANMPLAAHVVRLRAGFERKAFPSASSDALKAVVRAELLQLFERSLQSRRSGTA